MVCSGLMARPSSRVVEVVSAWVEAVSHAVASVSAIVVAAAAVQMEVDRCMVAGFAEGNSKCVVDRLETWEIAVRLRTSLAAQLGDMEVVQQGARLVGMVAVVLYAAAVSDAVAGVRCHTSTCDGFGSPV